MSPVRLIRKVPVVTGASSFAVGFSAVTVTVTLEPALIVPETKPLDDLLADLQRERSSLAVVVDDLGQG